MRYPLFCLVLAGVLISGHRASADTPVAPAARPAPKAAVIRIMNDTGQALLWDGDTGEYTVVRLGSRIHNLVVTAIDTGQVVLSDTATGQHFVLPTTAARGTAPGLPSAVQSGGQIDAAITPPAAPTTRSSQLLDPYAPINAPAPGATATERPTIVDPYGAERSGEPGGFTGAGSGPVDRNAGESSGGGVELPAVSIGIAGTGASAVPDRRLSQPPGPAEPATDPLTPVADKVPHKAAAAASPPRAGKTIRVSRREFDAAVGDFHALSQQVDLVLVADGVRVDRIARGSLAARFGLKPGDVILRVADRPIRGVDDAAGIYAYLMDATAFTARVKRDTGVVLLRYRFVK